MLDNTRVINAGRHDYYNRGNYYQHCLTFSIGIFQWKLTADKKRLKESGAIIRVKGTPLNAEKVYAKCDEICKELDAGKKFDTKQITVK